MRRIALALLVVMLALQGNAGAMVPPDTGDLPGPPAAAGGAIGTPNVEFIANFPDLGGIGAKILGDTIYMTTPAGLQIYDISLGVPVLIGALTLPHFENEAVDTNGETLLIAHDGFSLGPHLVYVVDVSLPQAPILLTVVRVSDAHTATCIQDCTFAWTSGGDVIDLREPGQASVIGRVPVGYIHNTNVDAEGLAWVRGNRVYDTNVGAYGASNASNPPTVATGGGFGWHNSIRPDAGATTPQKLADGVIDPGELVVGTDEDWLAAQNGFCEHDGPFKTSWFHTVNGEYRLDPLDRFTIGQGTLPDAKPLGAVSCSSHWLDVREDVVADAWYEQGVRFLDVSDPRNIRQVGYFMPAVTEAWQAIYHQVADGPLPGTYVYVFDVARGLDVLRWTGSSSDPTALAPRVNPTAPAAPHPTWGWACRVPLQAG